MDLKDFDHTGDMTEENPSTGIPETLETTNLAEQPDLGSSMDSDQISQGNLTIQPTGYFYDWHEYDKSKLLQLKFFEKTLDDVGTFMENSGVLDPHATQLTKRFMIEGLAQHGDDLVNKTAYEMPTGE